MCTKLSAPLKFNVMRRFTCSWYDCHRSCVPKSKECRGTMIQMPRLTSLFSVDTQIKPCRSFNKTKWHHQEYGRILSQGTEIPIHHPRVDILTLEEWQCQTLHQAGIQKMIIESSYLNHHFNAFGWCLCRVSQPQDIMINWHGQVDSNNVWLFLEREQSGDLKYLLMITK